MNIVCGICPNYKHCKSKEKPQTKEEWLRSASTEDVAKIRQRRTTNLAWKNEIPMWKKWQIGICVSTKWIEDIIFIEVAE